MSIYTTEPSIHIYVNTDYTNIKLAILAWPVYVYVHHNSIYVHSELPIEIIINMSVYIYMYVNICIYIYIYICLQMCMFIITCMCTISVRRPCVTKCCCPAYKRRKVVSSVSPRTTSFRDHYIRSVDEYLDKSVFKFMVSHHKIHMPAKNMCLDYQLYLHCSTCRLCE